MLCKFWQNFVSKAKIEFKQMFQRKVFPFEKSRKIYYQSFNKMHVFISLVSNCKPFKDRKIFIFITSRIENYALKTSFLALPFFFLPGAILVRSLIFFKSKIMDLFLVT